MRSHYVTGIVLGTRHPQVNRKQESIIWMGKTDRSLKRRPSGDATKLLPEKNAIGAWIAFHRLGDR